MPDRDAEESVSQPIELVYQDQYMVAVNKPSGIMTHPSRLSEDRAPSAMELLRDRLGQWVYPIHRLDRATSGVLLFALDPEIARSLHEQFATGMVKKQYLAVTRGYAPDRGEIDRPLQEKRDRITDRDAQINKAPQEAQTSFETWARVSLATPLGRYPTARFSLVAAYPHTGRRHQIRRHLAGINYPLIGDTTHGRGEINRFMRSRYQCNRLLLSAINLKIRHPLDPSAELSIEAPLSGEMAHVCAQLFLPSENGHEALELHEGPLWLTDSQSLRQRIASLHA